MFTLLFRLLTENNNEGLWLDVGKLKINIMYNF